MTVHAKNLDEVREAIAAINAPRVKCGGTKTATSSGANLCVADMAGVLQYEPSEYTFTALAGTKLADVRQMLAEHGQFMPFDPPLVAAGGTLGGTVATGLSGSGRFRFGGVRDFLLGVQMVTFGGRVVFGGGKVVKNAAGFDIPKLMVGSMGKFGVMTELTFKVFPQPEKYSTLLLHFNSFSAAADVLNRLAQQPMDFSCLDLDPSSNTVAIRLGGIATSVPNRIDRVHVFAKSYDNDCSSEVLSSEEDSDYWSRANEFDWLGADNRLVKIPTTPSQMNRWEELFHAFGDPIPRRYCVGGNLLWVGWPTGIPATKLSGVCSQFGQNPVAITGRWPDSLDAQSQTEFEQRLLATFG